ncbi:MAG: hypothetical protein UR12_C0003G0006 [candidate division TM6 bacterium GW2011_GWF2_30_66]|nr:MAG: hypothetical protein UR12_C0003G0006 [candidate division TM6 bacterium GW2011_GWF2_30_66]
MIYNKINNIFLFVILFFNLSVFSMNNDHFNNTEIKNEDFTVVDDIEKKMALEEVKEFFLEICGEDVNLEVPFEAYDKFERRIINSKYPCRMCYNIKKQREEKLRMLKLNKISEENEDIFEFNINLKKEALLLKVCQKCAAIRVVKFLLNENFKDTYLYRKLAVLNDCDDIFKMCGKENTLEIVEKGKKDIIYELARSYAVVEILKSKEKDELKEINKKINGFSVEGYRVDSD